MQKDKYTFLCMVPSCIILAIMFALLSIGAANGVQYLEETEINHYVEIGENILNNDSQSLQDCTLKYELNDESITISSFNIFEQTVTIYFLGQYHKTVVNDPTINFLACSIFFGILAGIALIGSFIYAFKANYEFSKCKFNLQT